MPLSRDEYLEMAALAKSEGNDEAELEAYEGIEALNAIQQPPPQQSIQQQPQDYSFSPMNMISNIPSSAVNMAGNVAQAVMHPIDTAQGMGNLAAGGLYNANQYLSENTPEWMQFMAEPIGGGEVFGKDQEKMAEAAGGALADRYGGIEETLKTLESDPVGVVGDVAGVVSLGGMLAKSPALTTIGAALDPVNLASNTIKSALSSAIPKGTAANMYERAAKFSTTLSDKERGALVDTALKYDLPPTSKGVAALDDQIGIVDNAIDSLIRESASSGETISSQALFSALKELRQKKGGPLIEAKKDLRAINRYAKDMAESIKRTGKDRLTAQELQDIKRDTYAKISWDAKRQTGTPIKEDTYKAIAKGAKEGVEQLIPEVGALNRQYGELLELKPRLQQAAARIENRDIIGIKAPLSVAAGGAIDPMAGAAAGILSILDRPKVSASIAMAINELKRTGNVEKFLTNNPGWSRARLSAIIAGESMGALSPENINSEND